MHPCARASLPANACRRAHRIHGPHAARRVFHIVREEGGADGGVVVQDCMEFLNNLLRTNVVSPGDMHACNKTAGDACFGLLPCSVANLHQRRRATSLIVTMPAHAMLVHAMLPQPILSNAQSGCASESSLPCSSLGAPLVPCMHSLQANQRPLVPCMHTLQANQRLFREMGYTSQLAQLLSAALPAGGTQEASLESTLQSFGVSAQGGRGGSLLKVNTGQVAGSMHWACFCNVANLPIQGIEADLFLMEACSECVMVVCINQQCTRAVQG